MGFFGCTTTVSGRGEAPADRIVISGGYSLFPHQKRAAASVEHYLYKDTGRVLLHLPTGVGKTRTAMSLVASHLRHRNKGLVVWLAGTRELLEQAVDEFESTWTAVGDRSVECCRFWSSHRPDLAEIKDGIVVAGFAKLHSYAGGPSASLEARGPNDDGRI